VKRRIGILGSTGSIGTQALEVIREQKDFFEVELLTAGSNAALLIEQAIEFLPNTVVIGHHEKYTEVKNALSSFPIKVFCGEESIEQAVCSDELDMVLTAMVGFAGLKPTIAAIQSGKAIALANKETLVVAGELIMKMAREHKVPILPVDSEHSAIFQCLIGEQNNPIEKLILTASGGPFRGKTLDELKKVSKQQALKHPNWSMGSKITIDSASMMNKGLEVIEAHWLYGVDLKNIEVIVHPQSIIHSMVQFNDGSIKAQMGLPDMKLPIQYAMAYPQRLPSSFPRFDFSAYPNLSFESVDQNVFQCLALAYQALQKGGNMPCVLNAANEFAVDAFLNDKISFVQIPELISLAMNTIAFQQDCGINDLIQSHHNCIARLEEECKTNA